LQIQHKLLEVTEWSLGGTHQLLAERQVQLQDAGLHLNVTHGLCEDARFQMSAPNGQ
jgi:hypothetical protein